jgi:hypothetical protein
MGLRISESLGIDSPPRGLAMPKPYSADLRKRVIEAVEMGASRYEAADRFEVSVSFGGEVASALARKRERGTEATRRKRFSAGGVRGAGTGRDRGTSGLDVDGDGCAAAPAAHSNQQERTFAVFWSPRYHSQKKACRPQSGSERTWCGLADVGSGSKACLTQRGWYLSTRLRSAPTWCG